MIDPSGLPEGVLKKLKSGVDGSPFHAIARRSTKYGDVLVAERLDDGVWDVLWASGDGLMTWAQHIEFHRLTSQSHRIEHAVEKAVQHLREVHSLVGRGGISTH